MREDGEHFIGDDLVAGRASVAEIDEQRVGIFVKNIRQVEKIFFSVIFKQIVGRLNHGVAARMIAQFRLAEADFVRGKWFMTCEQSGLPEKCAMKSVRLR